MTVSYRERIYEHYATNFQDLPTTFSVPESRKWARAYDHYLRGWLPPNKTARVVDVACGGGKLLHFFKERGWSDVEGVDLSPEQVAISRQVVPRVELENAIDYLERNEGAFDVVTGFDIIEHLHKPEVIRFLDAALAALKPGGRLILQTPNADSPWGTMLRYGDFTHEVCFNPNSLSRLMNLSGFQKVEARELGPVLFGYSLKSTVRSLIWQGFRLVFKVWNVAELGTLGSGVFTRVMLISGTRA